ncbi:TPA: hypothetical protein TYI14_002083 [Streptococcus suis]|nr:hypothetical protein [Streptococcus suis]HEL1943104.1 hypothetical protein [Streptococcus suis]HEL2261512.1 hypothetical protein [Streptococcus suis]
MTLKTISDTPSTFTFNYTFKDHDTAQVAGHALMGYMTGTFEQPGIEVYYDNDKVGGFANCLAVEYIADTELTETFKRICDSFKDYYNNPDELTGEDLDDYEQEQEIEQEYIRQRVQQLKQSEDFDSLLEKVVAYELELLDYAERLLSDDPIPTDTEMAYMTLNLIGGKGVNLFKSLDEDNEYSGLVYYNAEAE